jgi:hypothetical protein
MAVVVAGSLLMAQVTGGVPGSPLAGVTPVEFEEFRLGLDDFLEVETSDEGLARHLTAPAVQLATACPRSAAPETWRKCRASRPAR